MFVLYYSNYNTALTSILQHENICKFPSDRFYNNKLRADDSVKKRPPVTALRNVWPAGPRWPILFCDVIEEEKEFFGFSEKRTEIDEITEIEIDEITKVDDEATVKEIEKILSSEEKIDFHSKYNPGQATKAVC